MRKIIVSVALMTANVVFAGGFRVSLQGVRQLAMAHTSAHAEDASVAFFNPAGISFIPSKLSVVAGGFGISSKITYQNPSTLDSYQTDNPIGTPIYAAIAYKVAPKVSLGFSFATPFGSTVNWGENWVGKDMVQKMQLKSFFFQPMLSIKLADWVSVGGSYIYATGAVDWDKAVTQLGGNINIKDEKAKGQGFGLGFYFRPNENLDVSVAYRSPIDMKAENGKITFSKNIPASILGSLGAPNGEDSFKATLPLVEEYTLAASYKVTPKWKVAADFNYTGWSGYNKLTLDFAKAQIGNQTDKTILVSEKNFKNTRTFRLGTEYLLTNTIAGRLGWYWDESPYEDKNFTPETPSFDNNVITAGLGFNLGSFGVDVAAAKTFLKSRTFSNPQYGFAGQAKSNAFYFGLGLRYNLK